MTATGVTFAHGIALGPGQRTMLTFVHSMTEGGRRPELTLRTMAARTGLPVSTVHNALARLRALGLIGLRVQDGRHGGHRLWRVRARAALPDLGAHRLAVRLLYRYFGKRAPARTPTPALIAPDRPVRDPSGAGPTGEGAQPTPDGPDHPYATRDDRPKPCPVHGCTRLAWGRELCHVHSGEPESFGDKMRRYGIGGWVDEKRHP